MWGKDVKLKVELRLGVRLRLLGKGRKKRKFRYIQFVNLLE